MSKYFKPNATFPECIRLGPNQLLERHCRLPIPIGEQWNPIIPYGYVTKLLTWKRWLFLQFHVGLLGAHRSADKTYALCRHQVYWEGMLKDFERWTNECLTCIRFHKVNTKNPAVPVVPSTVDC